MGWLAVCLFLGVVCASTGFSASRSGFTADLLRPAKTLHRHSFENRLGSIKCSKRSKHSIPQLLRTRCEGVGGVPNEFLQVYAGHFDNSRQRRLDPSVQFSRKTHLKIELPSLGEGCFFVSEATDAGNGMQYRLRIASLTQSSEAGLVVAEHYAFKSETLAQALQSESNWKLLDAISPEEDLELVDEGTVNFRPVPGEGEGVYEAKVEYEKCAASTSQPVRTEISSLLSPASWLVKATFRDSQGAVIRYTEVDMDRVCGELRP